MDDVPPPSPTAPGDPAPGTPAPPTVIGSWREGARPEAPLGRPRSGAGLCLSGGGYRAALFHLGATRRLNECGLLHGLDTVSSVSGGSLYSALLATTLPWHERRPFTPAEWQDLQARTQALCAEDIRTGPLLARLLPWRWSGPPAILGVADRLARHFPQALTDLPRRPDFAYCASDLDNGTNWTFRRQRSGGYLAGRVPSRALNWPLARAVAVSACFTPVFRPVILTHPALKEAVTLNDGGNYDNLGLEPVWKRHALVLVSDGGGRPTRGLRNTLIAHLIRALTTGDAQSRSLRRRWLMADSTRGVYRAVYWAVSQDVGAYRHTLTARGLTSGWGYPPEMARAIGRIRTDLNVFTPGEQAALINHGYSLADAALRAHLPGPADPWPDFTLPFPDWADGDRVRAAFRL